LNKRITIADVAQAAGVSSQTVSRAINDKGEISPETRERILGIARQLGFRPSNIARSLVRQLTTTIGIVIPDITNPFFSEIVRGVEDAARAHAYNVFLCNTDEAPERELSALDSLLDKQVDGVILCSPRLEEDELLARLEEIPYAVLINRPAAETLAHVRSLSFDDRAGACLAVGHLLERGHRRIGFLAGPRRSRSALQRLAGYRDCLASARGRGTPAPGEWVLHCEPDLAGGERACRELLSAQPELTALLCYNDLVAIGAIHAALDSGRRIPEDLSIIGFDDIPLASYVRPPLTTLRTPKREVGAAAMQALVDLMEGQTQAGLPSNFPPELILRSTTAAAPEEMHL
jgi:LacI family transcriptional regulator